MTLHVALPVEERWPSGVLSFSLHAARLEHEDQRGGETKDMTGRAFGGSGGPSRAAGGAGRFGEQGDGDRRSFGGNSTSTRCRYCGSNEKDLRSSDLRDRGATFQVIVACASCGAASRPVADLMRSSSLVAAARAGAGSVAFAATPAPRPRRKADRPAAHRCHEGAAEGARAETAASRRVHRRSEQAGPGRPRELGQAVPQLPLRHTHVRQRAPGVHPHARRPRGPGHTRVTPCRGRCRSTGVSESTSG